MASSLRSSSHSLRRNPPQSGWAHGEVAPARYVTGAVGSLSEVESLGGIHVHRPGTVEHMSTTRPAQHLAPRVVFNPG